MDEEKNLKNKSYKMVLIELIFYIQYGTISIAP